MQKDEIFDAKFDNLIIREKQMEELNSARGHPKVTLKFVPQTSIYQLIRLKEPPKLCYTDMHNLQIMNSPAGKLEETRLKLRGEGAKGRYRNKSSMNSPRTSQVKG